MWQDNVSLFLTSPSVFRLGGDWHSLRNKRQPGKPCALQQCLLPLPSTGCSVTALCLSMAQFQCRAGLRSWHQATVSSLNSMTQISSWEPPCGSLELPYYESFDHLQRANCAENYQEHFQNTGGHDPMTALLPKCWAGLQLAPYLGGMCFL